ncbi:unnamed protein product [Urochloa humidicola]
MCVRAQPSNCVAHLLELATHQQLQAQQICVFPSHFGSRADAQARKAAASWRAARPCGEGIGGDGVNVLAGFCSFDG